MTDTITILRVDTVARSEPSYRLDLIAAGIGFSGHLTDATASSRGILVSDQRGTVYALDGKAVVHADGAADGSLFGGLLGIADLNGTLYFAYTTPETEPPYVGAELVLADERGRELWRSAFYRIFPAQGVFPRNYGGGLAVWRDRILLGYGNGSSPSGVGDPKAGGVIMVDPASRRVDTVAVGLRSPFKLTVWGDDLLVSSVGQYFWDGIYRLTLGGRSPVNFGWPQWEGPLCRAATCGTPATAPWLAVPQSAFGCSSMMGGAVWRGLYWFTDFCEAWIRSYDGNQVIQHFDLPGRIAGVRNVGGRLLVLGCDGGKVWEITP